MKNSELEENLIEEIFNRMRLETSLKKVMTRVAEVEINMFSHIDLFHETKMTNHELVECMSEEYRNLMHLREEIRESFVYKNKSIDAYPD